MHVLLQSFRKKAMAPWQIFVIGSLLLTLVLIGGPLLTRRQHPLDFEGQKARQGARLLVLSLWLASLSMMAYIAFVFGKR
jgi:hypothetical protein